MSDLVQIPTDADQVTDSDEEVGRGIPVLPESHEHLQVFLLYTRLAAKPHTEAMGGLGYVDSRTPVLSVKIELDLPTVQPSSRKKSSKGTRFRDQTMAVEVELAQDPTSLRSRKGDTGSVLWRVR